MDDESPKANALHLAQEKEITDTFRHVGTEGKILIAHAWTNESYIRQFGWLKNYRCNRNTSYACAGDWRI